MSELAVIKRAGLSRNSYYKIFAPDRQKSPMRKSTVYSLADVLNQQVQYVEGFPQFTINQESGDFIPLHLAREAIQHLITVAGSVEELSNRTKVPIELFWDLISPDASDTRPVSELFLMKMGAYNGLSLRIDPSGNAEYINKTEKPSFVFEEDRFDESKLIEDFLDYNGYPKPADSGLHELFEEINIDKYQISESERQELFLIATIRNSDSTLERWVSILFNLRALDRK